MLLLNQVIDYSICIVYEKNYKNFMKGVFCFIKTKFIYNYFTYKKSSVTFI